MEDNQNCSLPPHIMHYMQQHFPPSVNPEVLKPVSSIAVLSLNSDDNSMIVNPQRESKAEKTISVNNIFSELNNCSKAIIIDPTHEDNLIENKSKPQLVNNGMTPVQAAGPSIKSLPDTHLPKPNPSPAKRQKVSTQPLTSSRGNFVHIQPKSSSSSSSTSNKTPTPSSDHTYPLDDTRIDAYPLIPITVVKEKSLPSNKVSTTSRKICVVRKPSTNKSLVQFQKKTLPSCEKNRSRIVQELARQGLFILNPSLKKNSILEPVKSINAKAKLTADATLQILPTEINPIDNSSTTSKPNVKDSPNQPANSEAGCNLNQEEPCQFSSLVDHDYFTVIPENNEVGIASAQKSNDECQTVIQNEMIIAENNAGKDVNTEDISNGQMEADNESPVSDDEERWKIPSNMCRICAKKSDSIESLFSEKADNLKVVDMIHTHLPIMVTPDDLLPRIICRTCISKLKVADDLVKTCVQADSILRTLLEQVCNTRVPPTIFPGIANNYEPSSQSTAETMNESSSESSHEDGPYQNESEEGSCQLNSTKNDEASVGDKFQVKILEEKFPVSQVLSRNDVSTIKELKAYGLKIMLVRLPTMYNLSVKDRQLKIMQILKTLKFSIPQKQKKSKSLVAGTSSVTSTAISVEPTNTEMPASATQDTDFKDTDCETFSLMETPTSDSEPVPHILPTESELQAETSTEKDAEISTETDPLPDSHIIKQRKANIFNKFGINPTYIEGQDETGALIKVAVKLPVNNDGTAKPSSVYMYVQSKETGEKIQNDQAAIVEINRQIMEQTRLAFEAAKMTRRKEAAVKKRIRKREKLRLEILEKGLRCFDCSFIATSKEEMTEHKKDHHKCRFCEKEFKCRSSAIEHERVHTKEKPFPCEGCNRSFRTKQQMLQHAQRHSIDQPYKCDICERRFSVKTTYLSHVLHHNGGSSYLCEICGKSYKLPSTLRLHKLNHRTFYCTHCNKTLTYRAYHLHKKSHSGEINFRCKVCDKQFLTLQRLQIHSLVHEATYPYCCGVCRRAFKRMTHLQCHRSRHSSDQLEGIDYYCCGVCSLQYGEQSELSQHVKSHTGEERQRVQAFKCKFCDKCFSVEQEMKSHEARHAEKLSFSCSTCNQSFDNRIDFEQHSTTHSEDKPFACEHCGKRFRGMLNLNNHRQVHARFKSFQCYQCPKAFKTPGGLNQHKLSHSDIRKHTCQLCNLSFKRRDALKNHERIHFADRPYACSICNKAFKVKADCTTHLKRHRETGVEGVVIESLYFCKVCSQTFTLSVDLSNHMQRVHSLDAINMEQEVLSLESAVQSL